MLRKPKDLEVKRELPLHEVVVCATFHSKDFANVQQLRHDRNDKRPRHQDQEAPAQILLVECGQMVRGEPFVE